MSEGGDARNYEAQAMREALQAERRGRDTEFRALQVAIDDSTRYRAALEEIEGIESVPSLDAEDKMRAIARAALGFSDV